MMRRIGICEERGSGIDKVAIEAETYQLPAPLFESPTNFTRVVLFAHKEFDDMDKDDRVRACYLHSALMFVSRKKMTNKTLRERFGLKQSETNKVTRIINATVEKGLIINENNHESRKYASYVPYWSKAETI